MDAILNGPGGVTQVGSGGITLGRTPENQVVVNDGKASSHHAEIRPSGQGFTITDLGSTNGTFVNGQRLEANTPRMLMPGDMIRIGDATYTYQTQSYQQGMYAPPAQASNYDPTQLAPAPQQPFQSTVYGGPGNYQPTMPAYPQYDQPYNQSYTPNLQQQGFTPPPPPPEQSGQSFYDQNNALTQQASYLAGGAAGTPGVPSSPYNVNQPYTPGMPSGTPPYNQSNPNNVAPIYPPVGGGYVPGPPQGPGRRKRSPLLTIVLVAVALLVVIGAVSAFFVTRNNQITQDNNTHGTATAVANNATQAANTQATSAVVANITATASAQNANPYTSGGTLALEDSLKDNTGGHGWEEDSNCQFTQSVYEVAESHSNTFFTCDAKSTNYSNIAFDVALKIIQGDCAGIAFRANLSNDAEYFFEMCQTGTYDLVMYDGTNSKYLIDVTSSSTIKTGTNQINTLGVVANGSTIQLFINGTSVDQKTDSTYSSGSIGLLAVNHNSSSTSVAYAGVRVWTL